MSERSCVEIACRTLRSEEEFWEAYLRETGPEGAAFFGRNLDALWDALHGGPGFSGVDEVRFTGAASLAALRNGDFLRALRKIAHSSEHVRIVIGR